MSIQPYNITLGEESPTFQYTPFRDGPVTEGWNSSYSGSIEWLGSEGSTGIGTPYRRTELNGAGFTLDFTGTALYLCLTSNNQAGYTVTVDNSAITKIASTSDSACSSFPGAEVLLVADGLSYGPHTATLNATLSGDESLDFYGGVVTLSAGPAGSTVSSPVWIDDRSTDWVYEPWPWPQGNAAGEYNGTHSYACNYLSEVTASISFNGTSIVQLIGSPTSNSFGYSVQLNQVQTVYNATNYWWADRQTLFFAGGLDPTQTYTLTLVDYDANQPNGPPGLNTSGFYCINLDAIVLVQTILPTTQTTSSGSSTGSTGASTSTAAGSGASQSIGADNAGGTSSPSSGSSALSGGAIAGIVIGILVVVALVVLIWFLLTRLKKRAQVHAGSGQAVFSNNLYRGSSPNPPDPTPFFSPVETTSAYTSDPPVSLSARAASAYRQEKSSRSPGSHPSGYTAVRQTPGPMSDGGTSSSSDPRLTHDILQNAPTVDLVTILNQRLRREQADNVEEPPQYG